MKNISHFSFCFISEKVLIQSKINCGILNDVSDLSFPKGVHEVCNDPAALLYLIN